MAAPATQAQDKALPKSRLAVTIYNNDQALIEDVRDLNLSAGRQRIEFPGVSARIQSETVALNARDIEIIEQNFDYDLLTPTKMMEKAVGSTVKLVRINPATGKEVIESAQILSVNEGVVLRIDDRIEVLRDDGLPVRVLFDRIPENLRAKPTLSVNIDAKSGGARPVTLRYLTGGLSWKADYVGVLDDKGGKLDLQGWVTLTNQSGTTYRDAKTQLVAGQVGFDNAPAPFWRGEPGTSRIQGVEAAGTGGETDVGEDLQDYRLYTLPEAVTIAENQTKQVSLIDVQGANAAKIYRFTRSGYESQRNPEQAQVKVMFENSKASGLGASLPAGTVRFYAKDSSGRAQFIGEDNIGHTPQGSTIFLNLGQAFDVTVQSKVDSVNVPVEGVRVTAMSYRFRNARAEAVTVDFQQLNVDNTNKIESSSVAAKKLNANAYGWTINVPARGETVLKFQIREGRETKRTNK